MLDLALTALLALTVPAAAPPDAPAAAGSPDRQSLLVPEAPPPDPSPTADEYQDTSPPPGSPVEVALWRAGMETTKNVWHSRAASAALRNELFQLDLHGRLVKAAGAAGHERAERLRDVAKRLRQAEARNLEIFKRRWTIDPYRACGYPQLNYDSAMRVAPGPNRQAEVAGAAADLQSCVDRASVPVKAMKESNQALAAAVAAAKEALQAQEKHEAHERQEHAERGERREKE